MRIVWFLVLLAPLSAAAEESWLRLMNDAAIEQALAGRTVVYDAYTMQTFAASGATQYITERAASGLWDVRSGQYCVVWPPSEDWACFDVQISDQRIRFIATDDSVSEGVFGQ